MYNNVKHALDTGLLYLKYTICSDDIATAGSWAGVGLVN
jgi:hypothetical protein